MENMEKKIMENMDNQDKINIMEKVEASGDCSSKTSNEAMNEEEVDMNEAEHDSEAGLVRADREHAECKICQEEDFLDKLEAPCNCNGTLKFAHRDCIQRWINERLCLSCEICHQAYEAGYTIVLPPPQRDPRSGDVTIAVRDGYFTLNSEQAAQRARIEAAAQFLRQQQLQGQLQVHNVRAFSGSIACRIGALICLAFLVVKDVYYFYKHGEEGDLFTIFCVMLGFFLPCYTLAWFASVWNQGDVEVSVSDVAVVSQSSRTLSSASVEGSTPETEP